MAGVGCPSKVCLQTNLQVSTAGFQWAKLSVTNLRVDFNYNI